MKIEDQIKTKGFKDEWHKVIVNIFYTSNFFERILEKRAAKAGLTLQQFNVLRILRGQYPEPLSNNIIRSRMVHNTSDISRLVDRMVKKDLIERAKKSTDKRSVDLLISEKGLQLLGQLEDEMSLTNLLAPHISAQETQQLSDLMDKLRGDIEIDL
ncbi:MarR family winged helix-turn-helix transcriptional regulator [Sphingobacterium sp. Mn56C]|uniref:MarR family winged helix-turn-helix transcriptional regulator n=1 Tax=Sphingobacterium sp. Mn56C TaxID=3395261 RepID=UPI003BE94C57